MKNISSVTRLILHVIPLILSAQEFASHWLPVNPGARSSALGRSTVMDDGSSSLFNNPAALGSIEHLTISAFANLNSLSQISGYLESLPTESSVETTPLKAPLNIVMLYPSPDVGYDHIKMTYGVGYTRFFQWVDEHSWSFQKNGLDYSRNMDHSSGVDVLHLGAGARMWNRIALGMTLNYIPSADYFSNDVLYVDSEYSDGIAETYSTESTVFFKAGMLATPFTSLNIGFTVTTPIEWLTTDYWTSDNIILQEHALYKSPLLIEYGISFIKGLVRVQYEGSLNSFSEMEINGLPIDIDDAVGNRFGFEYTKNASKIRLGYYMENLPARKIIDQTPIPMSGFTFGFGHTFKALTLDFALNHYLYESDAFVHPLFPEIGDYSDIVSGNIFIIELNYTHID